jgi:hypothetical protein
MRQRWSLPSGPWSSVLLAVSLAAAPAASAPKPSITSRAERAGAVCAAAVQHPIDVRVTALDPVRRGAPIRLQVQATSRAALERVSVRLVTSGGALLRGAQVVHLGRLTPGAGRAAEFRVELPAAASRALVQFEVRAEGPFGPLTRGATYSLLPDGPADPGREVVTADGVRVIEYAARKVTP